MSNNLDSFLTRIGDVTIERVAPRPPSEPSEAEPQPEPRDEAANEDTSEDSSEASDSEPLAEKSIKTEEAKVSDDDMDLDETIDSHIGVRIEAEHHQDEDVNLEAVNLLQNLPLEGAPIEGQEVSEADVLGKISKSEDEQEDDTKESNSSEDASETGKRQAEDSPDSSTKKQKVDEEETGTETGNETKMDKSKANMRRNIREVMDETQLDEATLAAQRQEVERLRRVQDQQKMLREVQRQFMINKQTKGQQRAVSLLQKQNFGGTTILPSGPSHSLSIMPGVGPSRGSSTVLTKINSGTVSGSVTQINTSQSHQLHSRPVPDNRWARGRPPYPSAQTSISRVPSNRAAMSSNLIQQRIRMMTPSVSISPVVPKKEPGRRMDLSDSELSDQEDRFQKLPGPKSPKSKEQLVTISSSSESSDDDCIVLSDPSGGDESDNEDDPSNSGMHTNDRYNVPDEQGRVLVNVGHPESEPDVFLAPQVARIIKPHQIGGIRFLYDNIVESIDRFKTSTGFGCILAHSMGLGKTLQVASFCDIFFRCTSAKTVLCIMPINTLQNWLAEFNMWLPYEDPNAVKEPVDNPVKLEKETENKEGFPNYQTPNFAEFPGQNTYPDYRDNFQDPNLRYQNEMKTNIVKTEFEEKEKEEEKVPKIKTVYSVDAPVEMEIRPRHFRLHILNDSHKTMAARARVVKAWQKDGGVLMIGYELYRQLSLKKPAKSKRKRGQPLKEAVDVEEEDKNKGLLDEMHTALVNPGPDLVICDEGHRIKNSHASISMALKQMRTKRRIVLTGYPLQNNLLEYWCMVDFVRPNYLGSKSEFSNMFERPIHNGQCIDSTPQDIRLMRYRAHVLHDLLEGFVQRRSHSVLQVSLPRKEEYILLVRMSAFQRKLYDTFMNQVVKTRAVPNPLKAFAVCCKIWNHPDILYHFLRKRQANEEDDLDLEETMGEKPAAGAKKSKARQPKGEGRKGRKGEKVIKKPAASVQPSTAQNTPEGPKDGAPKGARGKKPFADSFPVPGQNPGYNQGSSQQYQSGQEYPNYPSEGSQEYNEYYGNNQMYPQNSSYPQGLYPQGQNYAPGTADQRTQNQPRYPATSQGNQNYDAGFPRQDYPGYQDRGRNFNQNYPPQGSNFQNQMPAEYQNASGHSYPGQQNMNVYEGNGQAGSAGQAYLNQGQRGANSNQPGFQQNQQNHYQANQVPNYQQNQTAPGSGYPQTGQGLGQNQVRYPTESSGQGYGNTEGYQSYPAQNDPTGHRYPQSSSSQQSNQTLFVQNQQLPGSTSNYNCDQGQQSSMQNFPSTDAGQNQPGQFKNQDNQFWQRNQYPSQPYNTDQKYNEGFYRNENSASYRYQGNYYPQSSQDYPQNPGFDYPTPTPQQETEEDVKPVLPIPKEEETKPINKMETKKDEEDKEVLEKEKEEGEDEEVIPKEEEKDLKCFIPKEDPGIPYDWATELMKGYVPGLIDASGKMTLFFCILEEAIRLGDRVLAFSQSLFTLNLIEDFLARNDLKYDDDKTEAWVKNVNYYRLDGSTTALEREKLINGFNANPKIHLFLVSTRAGSLGINLVGANRAIVFDASWNPCHDTQAVCRVYRYGQQKKCYVYRLVTDNCLERKIYDRQISKQGMADRVVDQCNPDAHLSLKEATTLSWDWEEDSQVQDFSQEKDSYPDPVMHTVLKKHSSLLTKQPFHHESLLVDRKDKKLSQAEKRLARRGYELEKMAANCSKPSYNYVPGNTATRGGLQIRAIRGGGAPVDPGPAPKPVASVRPMQQRGAEGLGARGMAGSRWIPAEVWQRQGMSAQEMTLPLDVVIPTNSPDKGSIVLKAGQRVMVLKSPKGIYMQLESGKIIAIRTALKLNQQKRDEESRVELQKKGDEVQPQNTTPSDHTQNMPQPKPNLTPSTFSSPGVSSTSSSPRSSKTPDVGFPLRNNSAISIIPKSSSSSSSSSSQRPLSRSSSGPSYRPFEKEPTRRQRPLVTAAAKPYSSQVSLNNQVSLSRLPRKNDEPSPSGGENSNSSDGHVRTDQRVEEVQVEDIVGDVRYEGAPPARRLQEPPPDVTTNSAPSEQKPKERERPFQRQKELVPEDGASESRPQVAPQTPRSEEDKNGPEQGAPTDKISADVAEGYQDDGHLPQSYAYGQYPRYYDYNDPRSRSMASPYGSYYPGGPPPNSTKAPSVDGAKEDGAAQLPKSQVYSPEVTAVAAPPKSEPQPDKTLDGVTPTISNTPRDDAAVGVPGYAHQSGTWTYPPGPYDPYSQHYPPPHGSASSAAYPPAGAPPYPGYPAPPTYNADYARMYSAFSQPADPYMHHRGYAPPAPGHPPNYYPPFAYPPPPYPNHSFLPPYPNPNVPAEPQPPSQ